MKQPIFVIGFLLMTLLGKAQELDSLWITQFRYKNNVYYESGNSSVELKFLTKAQDSTYRYYPANFNIAGSQTHGIGLNYKFFSLSFVYNSIYNVRSLNNLSDLSLKVSVTKRVWGVESFIGHYNGLVSILDSGKYVVNPAIQFDRIGARFHLIRKYRRYSWRAPRDQSERQRKSAGSMILFIVPSWNRVSSPTNLLPSDTFNYKYYQNQWGLKSANTLKLEFMPGYAFTLSLFKGRFFISPLWAIGTGVSYNYYTTSFLQTHNFKYTFCGYTELNFGFNGAKWYCCFNTFSQSYNSLLDPVYFQYKTTGGKFTIGYRFGNLEKIIPEDIGVLLDRYKKYY